MNNQIILGNDGIYYYTFPPEVTSEVADAYIQELKILTDRVPAIKQVIDVSLIASLPREEVKNVLIEGMRKLRPVHPKDLNAISGVTTFLKIAARMILTIAGRHDIKIFETKEDAIKWITSQT